MQKLVDSDRSWQQHQRFDSYYLKGQDWHHAALNGVRIPLVPAVKLTPIRPVPPAATGPPAAPRAVRPPPGFDCKRAANNNDAWARWGMNPLPPVQTRAMQLPPGFDHKQAAVHSDYNEAWSRWGIDSLAPSTGAPGRPPPSSGTSLPGNIGKNCCRHRKIPL